MVDNNIDSLAKLYNHLPNSWIPNPELVGYWLVTIRCCQLSKGNSHLLLCWYGFPKSSSVALEDWCMLFVQFHESLLSYSEVLQSLVIPNFQDDMVPPHHCWFSGTRSSNPPISIPLQFQHWTHLFYGTQVDFHSTRLDEDLAQIGSGMAYL